jgi:hypothetical protein
VWVGRDNDAHARSDTVIDDNRGPTADRIYVYIGKKRQWTQTEPEYRGWVWGLYALILRTQRLAGPVARLGADRALDWYVVVYKRVCWWEVPCCDNDSGVSSSPPTTDPSRPKNTPTGSSRRCCWACSTDASTSASSCPWEGASGGGACCPWGD